MRGFDSMGGNLAAGTAYADPVHGIGRVSPLGLVDGNDDSMTENRFRKLLFLCAALLVLAASLVVRSNVGTETSFSRRR